MKKAILLIGMSLFISLVVTACGQKEKRTEGSTPAIQNTQIPDLSDDNDEPEPENTSTNDSEVSDNEEKNIDTEAPDFISGGDAIGSYKETIFLGDYTENGNQRFELLVPKYQTYTDQCTVLNMNYAFKILLASNTFLDKKAESKSLEDVMTVMDFKIKEAVKSDLKKNYGTPEMEITSQEDVTLNNLDFVHFTGNIIGVSRDGEGKSKKNGTTYYMEGYTYVHTNNTPVFIVGVLMADNEATDPDFYGGDTKYPEKFKEEMTHNLHEMMKTIQYRETKK